MSEYSVFTSESVSEGHPDKIADQISDAVLDAIIAKDKYARVACETLVKTGVAIIAGEVTTSAWVDLEELVRKVIIDIGYDRLRRRLRWCHLRRAEHHRQAVGGHQPGRRPGQTGRPGRRRPGPDVRLRQQRDRRADAGADLLLPPPGRAPGRGAQVRPAAMAAPGRQVPGDLPLRRRQGGRHRCGGAVHPAQPGSLL